MKRRAYTSGQRSQDQKRTAAVMLVTMRASLENYTAEDLSRATGLALPEASSILERELMTRRARANG